MPEILSQQEIDSLLSGITAPHAELPVVDQQAKKAEKEVLTFDFRLPHRLSKNQLRTLQAVHESFAESLGSYLVSRLQTNVTVNVTSVDQLFYSEFVLSIGSPSCLYIFRIVESDALALVEFSPQLVLVMVEHLLGGSSEGEKKPRLITKIEQSIVGGIVERTLMDLQRSWKTIANLTFKVERYESEGDFAQIAPASEIVLVVSLEVSIGAQKYLMNVCFPTFALDEVLAKLNVQHVSTVATTKRDDALSMAILRKLESTTVPVIGVLGATSFTLGDLLTLQVGDVVRTNIPTTGEVQVFIGGKRRLWGTPGISNGKIAVKLTKMNTEDATAD